MNDMQTSHPVSNTQFDKYRSTPKEDGKTYAEELELKEAEIDRLREKVEAVDHRRYRKSSAGLIALGTICGIVGLVIPSMDDIMFSFAGIGLFIGLLTYYLMPSRLVSADVTEQIYSTTAKSFEKICSDLELSDRRLYIPLAEHPAGNGSTARLFIPQQSSTPVPSADDLDSAFITRGKEQRGLSVIPIGDGLYKEFVITLQEPLANNADLLCEQLIDALIENFELADKVEYNVDTSDGRASIRIHGGLYRDGPRFDHPITSFIAVGLANGLGVPVSTVTAETEQLSVTYEWDTEHEDRNDWDEERTGVDDTS